MNDETRYEIIEGDCIEVMRGMEAESVDAVVTSPPYAMQRKGQYGGVDESEYPSWTVDWMREARRLLCDEGSVLINIREHVKNGVMSDYVHRTRMALRDDGWYEWDELIWNKVTAPPLGHPHRPRRAWERILWFGKSRQGACYPKANGKQSNRIGLTDCKKAVEDKSIKKPLKEIKAGVSRCTDVATFNIDTSERLHPAMFPVDLAAWMAKLAAPSRGRVLDPFCGSGSTGKACKLEGFGFVGIDMSEEYCAIARERIGAVEEEVSE